ncbi:type II toxin-antitoxin system VapC family toxin [Ramlibacter rhizophilus]|nr:PIN domain-containing protein [Ramlibacter rhizophilus]
MSFILIDASVMVALFNDAERTHAHYASLIGRLGRDRLATTWPCVTEASYLLAPRNHFALLHWLHHGAATVVNFETEDLMQIVPWMRRYTELGKALMDLADASLVWLAMHLETRRVLTEDHRDFIRYRLPDGKAFELVS